MTVVGDWIERRKKESQTIGAKTLHDLISLLEDMRDEYDMGDQLVLIANEQGTVDGFVTGVDGSDDGAWILFEEVEE